MFPVLVLDTTELPYVPAFLSRYEYWSFFIQPQAYEHGVEEGNLVVRRHRRVSDLVPLPLPAGYSRKRLGFTFREVVDYPDLNALRNIFGDSVDDEELVTLSDELPCHSGTKLGGWPYTVQGAYFLQTEQPDYDIQLSFTELYMYADAGLGHVYGGLKYITWETI